MGHQLLAYKSTEKILLPVSDHGSFTASRSLIWEVYEQEGGDELVQRTVMAERCFKTPLVLYSENGSPMKAQTMMTKLYDLGIKPSRSRPRISNDNAYSESLFWPLKHCPMWPTEGFKNLIDAREWAVNSHAGTTKTISTADCVLSRLRNGTLVKTRHCLPNELRFMSKLRQRIQHVGQDKLATGTHRPGSVKP